MIQNHLIDLDEALQSVLNPNSREYIAEAIAAYRSRAYRSAIMGTWVAVAYDIISKIRDLALEGDAAAAEAEAELDAAIAQSATNYVRAVKSLQAIENGLLDKALNRFEFVTQHEHTDLERLKQDRNLCAHPAFIADMELFQPSPELVRTHIAHAIHHLLAHPATQGKGALARLKNDILQPSFPTEQRSVNEFMEARYFGRAKRSLLDIFVRVMLKILIKNSEPDLVGHADAVLACLNAFAAAQPEIFKSKMAVELPRLTEGSDDAELMRVFRIFSTDRRCWSWLPQAIRIKLEGIVQTYVYTAESMPSVVNALDVDELRPKLLARVEGLSTADKESVLSRFHRPMFVDLAVELFAGVQHFRDAYRIGAGAIRPKIPLMNADQVRRLLAAARSNYEIYGAGSSTSALLVDVFEKTSDLHNETRASWQSFMTSVQAVAPNNEHPMAHPSVRALMENAGMWPAY